MKCLLSFVMLFASSVAMGQTYSKDLEKAAKKGDVVAQRDLGISYLKGAGTSVDNQKAFEWLCSAARQDAQAQYYLGVMFEEGKADVSKDKNGNYARLKNGFNPVMEFAGITDPSIFWYTVAAFWGNSDGAFLKLALNSRANNNEGDAIAYFQEAADLGNEQAKAEIEKYYKNFDGITINKETDLIVFSDNEKIMILKGVNNMLFSDNSSNRSDDYENKERIIILKGVNNIPSEAYAYCKAKEIIFEESETPLYIGQDAFCNLKAQEIIFNRPVYIEGGAFRNCCPDLVVFNKDVENIGLSAFGDKNGVRKMVFKKTPKALAHSGQYQFVYPDEYGNANIDIVEIPAGTADAFAAFHIPREKLYEQGGKALSLNIQLEKPNTILSVLPIDKLPSIDSLTITGFMYETDLKVLESCKNMRYLDLSRAYITLSPEKQKENRAESQAMAALFRFMGAAADAKYNDFEMSTLDYAYAKGFAKLMEQSYQVSEADEGCIIPGLAMQNMQKLETLILPARASRIEVSAFKNCKALKNVKLPPYLKSIGGGAFNNCFSLESIDFPTSLISIGECFDGTGLKVVDLSKCDFGANRSSWEFKFVDMGNLTEVRAPQGITNLKLSASKAKTFYIPESVKVLTVYPHENIVIHLTSPTPPEIGDVGIPVITNSTIYIPKGSTTAYYSLYGSSNKYIEE